MSKANLKSFWQPVSHSAGASVALLVLRLIAGIAFIHHGWGKIQTPFAWAGPESNIPGFFQLLAAISEFGGGFAWAFGFLTPLFSFGLLCTMSVAVHMHMIVRHDPFVNLKGGLSYEPALVYWGIAVLLLVLGPGFISLDRIMFGKRK